MVYSQAQEMLDELSDRMLALLKANPEWQDQAEQIAGMLEANNPDLSSPEKFVRSVLHELRPLADRARKLKFDPAKVDSPADLVNNLLPSDHHLD